MRSPVSCLAHGDHDCRFLLEPSCRGKGFGTEAALMMMSYGKEARADRGEVARPQARAGACWEPGGSGEDGDRRLTARWDRWGGGCRRDLPPAACPFLISERSDQARSDQV